MAEPWFPRIRPGVFLSWSPDGPQLCHVDHPLDVFAVSADLVRVLVQLAADVPVDDALGALDVPDDAYRAVHDALRTLVSAGILTEAAKPTAVGTTPLRDTAQEAARRLVAHPDIEKLDPAFIALYRTLSHSTLTSVALSYALRQAVQYVVRSAVPGALVECGVWRGGSMALAASTLAELGVVDRDLWLYDTFDWHWDELDERDGFTLLGNLRQAGVDQVGGEEHLRAGTSVEDVRTLLGSTGYPQDLLHFVPGYVQDTVPQHVPDQIALLRLDTDLYESTLHELRHLYPRLASGGVLIVDDYGKLDGATQAVDEYFAGVGDPPLLHRVDIQGRVAVKPGPGRRIEPGDRFT